MHILVIGGTRFIGPYIVRRLVALGHQVTLFHRGTTTTELPESIKHIYGDRKHLSQYRDIFSRLSPLILLDMIPLNQEEALSVTRTFEGIARRVVAISSQDVYRAYGRLTGLEPGPPEPVPLTETSPLREKLFRFRTENYQAQSKYRWQDHYEKIQVEQVVLDNPHLPGSILRLPMVYGPGDPQHRLYEYVKRMEDKRPAILLEKGLSGWCWTKSYVENIAEGIVMVLQQERAAHQIYNIGEAETLSEQEWVTEIGRTAGWKGIVVAIPRVALPEDWPDDMDTNQHLVVDSTKIRKEMGYDEIIQRDEALRQTIAWEIRHPPSLVDPRRFNYALEDSLLEKLSL
jgi:nucleoside-diphosphate-sugar epimerase